MTNYNYKIKYDKSVPQEIKDLMGEYNYRFISTRDYCSRYWRKFKASNSVGNMPNLINSEFRELMVGDWEDLALEDIVTRLQEYTSDPNYIKGKLDGRVGYEGPRGYFFSIELKKEPTQKELNNYEELKIQYNKEKELAIKLEKLIKKLVQEEKDNNLEREQKELQKQLNSVNNRLKKLGK
jgi:hypothetical protein